MSPSKFFLRAVLTATALFVLLRAVGASGVGEALEGAHFGPLAAMYVLLLARRLLETSQLSWILRSVGIEVSYLRTLLANTLAAFYSLVLPGEVASSAAKWGHLSAATGARSGVFNALVYNRLAILAPMTLLGVVALSFDDPFAGTLLRPLSIALVAAVIALSLALYHPRLGARLDAVARGWIARWPGRVEGVAASVLDALADFRELSLRQHGEVALLSLLAFAVASAQSILGARALDIPLSLETAAWLTALLSVTRLLPITIGNLGVREAVVIAALGPYGVSPQDGMAFGLVLFSNTVVVAAFGGVYQLALIAGFARAQPATADVPRPGRASGP